jgi:hypothetical protein
MTEQHHDRQTMGRLREHFSRADNELREAQHFLAYSAEEAEMDIVHAVAAARLAVATALQRVHSRLAEPQPYPAQVPESRRSRYRAPGGERLLGG